mgnify:CR=1 FL=1
MFLDFLNEWLGHSNFQTTLRYAHADVENKRISANVISDKLYIKYIEGYTDEQGKYHDGYLKMVTDLLTLFPLGHDFVDEEAEKSFIKLFGSIRRAINILQCFDAFSELPVTLTEGMLNNYTSVYLDLKDKYRPDNKGEETDVNDDISFEIELIKQVEVSIAYILHLVSGMQDMNSQNREIQLKSIRSLMGASPDLRDKRALIEDFISRYTPCDDVLDTWNEFIAAEQERELMQISEEEGINNQKAYEFMANAFKDGRIPEEGTAITEILPDTARSFFKGNPGNRSETKKRILDKMKVYFEKYYSISGGIYPRGERLESTESHPTVNKLSVIPETSHVSFADLLQQAGMTDMNVHAAKKQLNAHNPKPDYKCPALSCRQPWATLLCSGIKDIENRSWPTDYRGRVFIVASTGNDTGVFRHRLVSEELQNIVEEQMRKGNLPSYNGYQQSAVIGYVDIENCTSEHVDSPWGNGDKYNWKITNAYIFDEPQCVGIKAKFFFFDLPELDINNLPPAHKIVL